MTLSRKQAAALLGISLSTLQRRTKAGRYTATKTGQYQFAEVTYTYAGIGLPEPFVQPDIPIDANYDEGDETPEPVATVLPPKREPSNVDLKAEQDQEFAAKYLAGQATDSSGNRVDGTNRKFPSKGIQSLLGPVPPPEPRTPQSGTSHMNPALLSDWPDPSGAKPLIPASPQIGTGSTRHGAPLAAGYSQEQYDADMRKWKANGGGRSMGDQELATRRSTDTIRAAFPKADRT
jgi:hypothetical protein